MKAEANKPQLVRQWADWCLLRHAPGRYELVRGKRSLSQAFEAKDDQAAIKESSVIVKILEKIIEHLFFFLKWIFWLMDYCIETKYARTTSLSSK